MKYKSEWEGYQECEVIIFLAALRQMGDKSQELKLSAVKECSETVIGISGVVIRCIGQYKFCQYNTIVDLDMVAKG